MSKFQVQVESIDPEGWVIMKSSHFGTFGGKLFVAPNTIDFSDVFGKNLGRLLLGLTEGSSTLIKVDQHQLKNAMFMRKSKVLSNIDKHLSNVDEP